MEGGAVGHNFEREPPRDHPCQVWFNLVQWFQRRRFKCDYVARSSFAYIPDFSVKIFFQPIYTDYAN
jgi:hypothetical protein